MSLIKGAALVACAGLLATTAHASILESGVFYSGQPGFYETAPIYLPAQYKEAFQITFTYDKSLFGDAQVYLDGDRWLFYRPNFPPPYNTEYEEHGLLGGAGFDVDTPKLIREENTNAPLMYFQPTSTGFILTAWDDGDPCRTRPAEKELCHEIGSYRFINVYGHSDSGQVIPFEYKLDAAPQGMAVPEPATWAMMIAGFGLVGATLRRKALVAA